MIFKNATVFVEGNFQLVDVATTGDLITEISSSIEADEFIDCNGKLLLPGLIDIHSHGCGGFDFSTATTDEMKEMCNLYASKGVTSILATTMTEEPDLLKQAMRNINTVMSSDYSGSTILGINMEGPFLGVDKKGAHDPQYLRPIDAEYFEELNNLSGDNIRLIDLDPRLDGALDFISTYSKKKTISLAHTSCDYTLGCKACAAGASHITHLFNAMNGLHHREPSLIGTMSDNDVHAELIADGIHLHPSVVRMMFKLDPQKMVLISDSMCASGLDDGIYELGGQKVIVKNKKATLEGGTIAGSTTNVHEALKNCIQFGVKKEDAILSATLYPAKAVKADSEVGEISIGKRADMILTDENFNIEKVFIRGKEFPLT